MREDECYNCVHLKEQHSSEDAECEIEGCDCGEWEPFPTPTDEPD